MAAPHWPNKKIMFLMTALKNPWAHATLVDALNKLLLCSLDVLIDWYDDTWGLKHGAQKILCLA